MKDALSLIADALLVLATVAVLVYMADVMVFGFDRPGLFT